MLRLSEYTSQYGTALMMNLLLRFEGKVRAEECAGALLGVLMDLLDHPNVQVRTYVNGALYSALARTAIRQKGREIGLPEMLRLVRYCDSSFFILLRFPSFFFFVPHFLIYSFVKYR